ncbi:hypothetical protein A4A49_37814 [Nicotiana attenuata]|uniref:Phytosulfokine receptor 1 n=1 Tax=Nicotiana attenuata TaxID=49451 RepID=A0A1J6K6Z2_NICAT|nr:hypothetical protein A4A49_37814 [Nicotiana attenuata]
MLSVDLSGINSGRIPQTFSSLSTMSFMNLSYNNLTGKIHVSTQLESFNPSGFQGNKLCGLPLMVNCSSGSQIPDVDTEKDESEKDELDRFYISMAIGFCLSFWGDILDWFYMFWTS